MAAALYAEHYQSQVCVIAPASLCRHWRHEVGEWLREDLREHFTFASYDQFSGGKPAGTLLVLDEAHLIKNDCTGRFRRVFGDSILLK